MKKSKSTANSKTVPEKVNNAKESQGTQKLNPVFEALRKQNEKIANKNK